MEYQQRCLPAVSTGHTAFFFDIDGTLAALQPTPDLTRIPEHVRRDLQLLHHKSGGALAVISGRPLAEIDQLLAPLVLPAAGIHGAERRDASGHINRIRPEVSVLAETEQQLTEGLRQLPGVRLEKKGIAFALHYRQAKHFASRTQSLARSIVDREPALALVMGKCVAEIKPASIDKGRAIRAFMQQFPFQGRIPVFAGDDITDERGFIEVNSLNGISVKVGEGKTHADYRLQSVTDVHAWLKQLITPGIQPFANLRSDRNGKISRSI